MLFTDLLYLGRSDKVCDIKPCIFMDFFNAINLNYTSKMKSIFLYGVCLTSTMLAAMRLCDLVSE